MTRSMVKPEAIWLRKTELTDDGLFLLIRVRSNIKQITVGDSDKEKHIEFEYDENEIRYQVPERVKSLAEIQSLITANATDIFSKANTRKAWEDIQAQPIDELRKAIGKL